MIRLSAACYEAVILDLDGVITQTAKLHAAAWKALFDEYRAWRQEHGQTPFVPFEIEPDYVQHVDGKPRYDGVRDFLASRGIHLPDGQPQAPAGFDSVCALGNRKNVLFLERIDAGGVEVYADTVELVRDWRQAGLKTAVVSSSRNCARILRATGLAGLFDVQVDGVLADDLGLPGKPAPDTFLEAARRLRVAPDRAVVVEDAYAGVQAGRRGGFAQVVGVARQDGGAALLEQAGADVVVRTLGDLTSV